MEYTSSNRIDDFINMQKEQEHTLAAIRECLAKNMPANGKAVLSAHKLEVPPGRIVIGIF